MLKGLTGWLSAISLLLLIMWQRQQLLRAWKGAFFIDTVKPETVSIVEVRRNWKFLGFKKELVPTSVKAPVIHCSLLYTDKANAKELRGFSKEDIADIIDQSLV